MTYFWPRLTNACRSLDAWERRQLLSRPAMASRAVAARPASDQEALDAHRMALLEQLEIGDARVRHVAVHGARPGKGGSGPGPAAAQEPPAQDERAGRGGEDGNEPRHGARRGEADPVPVAGDEGVDDLGLGSPGGELLGDLAPDLGRGLRR